MFSNSIQNNSNKYMIPLPNLPKIIKKQGNKAVFEIEGLYPGYGVTISNTLRRVLLSSLEGAAITQVKIKGVSHEFSTIPGVLEDVVIILLNLKKIRFKSFSDEPQQVVIKQKGEKVVKAGDFEVPPQLEIKNPEAPVASLTSKSAQLQIEALVEKGVGYQSIEQREEKKREIGMIPIDAVFTPVKRVSFRVENMRVGKRTDFDKLEMEIETDGTISPEEAFLNASEILLKHFSLFSESRGKVKKETKEEKKVKIKKKKKLKSAAKKTVKKKEYEKKKKRKKTLKK
ncbi:MAG: DNA-directed RNA polymerase subunit alpha [Parcubacteria group bacterium CG2_30_36_21]|nr:MAG: DNA-directed RNA polymerase subunit alpha [Parcubacteria group bacterium CG2_30_36_21]